MGCGADSCSNGCMASPRGCENQGCCDGSGRLLGKSKGEGRSNRRSQTLGAPAASLMRQPDFTDDCVQHVNELGEEIQHLQNQLHEIEQQRAGLITSKDCTTEMATASNRELLRCQEKLDACVQEKDRAMKRLEEEASRGRQVRMRVPHAGQFAHHHHRTRANHSGPTTAHSPTRLSEPAFEGISKAVRGGR
jgi:predicted RNase H-like nuclease (RuvC/YqgF family)